jgi:predicted nucleic acid-binding protein
MSASLAYLLDTNILSDLVRNPQGIYPVKSPSGSKTTDVNAIAPTIFVCFSYPKHSRESGVLFDMLARMIW